jgi:transcriptional regulator with XRE-family HTH domain
MSGIGLTQDQIGKIMGVSDDTLRKYYSDELAMGTAKMNAAVAQNLYSIATGSGPGAVPSAIFWMKTRGGWREVERKEITGPGGGPVELVARRAIPDDIDDARLKSIEAALRLAIAPPREDIDDEKK